MVVFIILSRNKRSKISHATNTWYCRSEIYPCILCPLTPVTVKTALVVDQHTLSIVICNNCLHCIPISPLRISDLSVKF